MREFERISRIMGLIEEIWKLKPDYRFIQLVEMIKARYSSAHKGTGQVQYYYKENGREWPYNIIDLFHIEDYDFECYLYALLEEIKSIKFESDVFFERLLELFPGAQRGYETSLIKYGERLDTVMLEDVFMPEITKLINENKDIAKIKQFFMFLEDTLIHSREPLKGNVYVTILESLGNEASILATASCYMGTVTKQLQLEADKGLGRKR